MSRGNTMLQLTADETMRGWVMALWTVAFLGTTPIGGPVVGYVAQHAGPRWGLALGGLAALTTTALAAFPHLRLVWQLNRDRARPTAQPRSVTGHRSFTDMVPTVATSSDREPAGKWAAAQPGPHAGWLSGTAGSFVSFLLSQFLPRPTDTRAATPSRAADLGSSCCLVTDSTRRGSPGGRRRAGRARAGWAPLTSMLLWPAGDDAPSRLSRGVGRRQGLHPGRVRPPKPMIRHNRLTP
jgi:MFS family permease